MAPSTALEQSLVRWSTLHAACIAVAGTAAALQLPFALVSAAGAISFALLGYRFRGQWTPRGRFGAANAITFARAAAILLLPALEAGIVAGTAALVLFALDGIDGYIARRTGTAGPFGEFADKEADALLVLVLGLMLYRAPDGYGAWVLLPGMLRYVFVLFVATAKPPQEKEQRTRLGPWIAGLLIVSLAAAVAVHPRYSGQAMWWVAAMTAAVCCSFGESVYRLYRDPAIGQ